MAIKQRIQITKVNKFHSSKRNEDFFVVEGLFKDQTGNENSVGHERIMVFTTQEIFDKLYQNFKFLMEIDVDCQINGNRVNFEINDLPDFKAQRAA
jgi:predicted component of type VI protein secretion system